MARRIIAALLLVLTFALTLVPSFAAPTVISDLPLDNTTVEEDFILCGFDADDWFASNPGVEPTEDNPFGNPTIALTTDYFDSEFKEESDSEKVYLYAWVYFPNLSEFYKDLMKNNSYCPFELVFNSKYRNVYVLILRCKKKIKYFSNQISV